jgi:hypothetical protein
MIHENKHIQDNLSGSEPREPGTRLLVRGAPRALLVQGATQAP